MRESFPSLASSLSESGATIPSDLSEAFPTRCHLDAARGGLRMLFRLFCVAAEVVDKNKWMPDSFNV